MFLIDTNILLRYFTRDDKRKAEKVLILLKEIESGKKEAAISAIVIFEVIFTLESFYQVDRKEIQELLNPILGLQNLKLNDKNIYFEALEIYVNKNISFADAFNIAFAVKNKIKKICSYDRDFDKFGFIKRIEP